MTTAVLDLIDLDPSPPPRRAAPSKRSIDAATRRTVAQLRAAGVGTRLRDAAAPWPDAAGGVDRISPPAWDWSLSEPEIEHHMAMGRAQRAAAMRAAFAEIGVHMRRTAARLWDEARDADRRLREERFVDWSDVVDAVSIRLFAAAAWIFALVGFLGAQIGAAWTALAESVSVEKRTEDDRPVRALRRSFVDRGRRAYRARPSGRHPLTPVRRRAARRADKIRQEMSRERACSFARRVDTLLNCAGSLRRARFGRLGDEDSCSSGGDRRRRRRLLRPLPFDEGRLERRCAVRALRADLGIDLARGRRLPHPERRSERRQAAEVHDRPLQGDRTDFRPGDRAPYHRRRDAGRHARSA